MGNTLYIESNMGISGDMTVAALLDAGADENVLNKALDSIKAKGFSTKISRVKKAGLDICDFDVILDAEHDGHDHDMEYLYGYDHDHSHDDAHGHMHEHNHDHDHDHEHTHSHDDAHDHDHNHNHEHTHDYDHEHSHAHSHDDGNEHEHNHAYDHSHHHEHRGINDIFPIIDACDMTESARELAKKIFRVLAEAESKAHGVPIEEVHFHEVGALDSIVDIISIAVCFDNLNIDKVIVPYLSEGTGTVRCQHGILPVPVPAVVNIVESYKLPMKIVPVKGELVTPTGAAFVASVMTDTKLPESFTIESVGMGNGKREYERPGILRVMIIS